MARIGHASVQARDQDSCGGDDGGGDDGTRTHDPLLAKQVL